MTADLSPSFAPLTAVVAPPTVAPLTLEAPAPVAPVPAAQADKLVKLDPALVPALDAKVAEYLAAVVDLDVHSDAFTARVRDISSLGDEDMRASAAVSNRLLERPVNELSKSGLAESSAVARTLADLRHTVEDLDPNRNGNLLAPRKLLGILPLGGRLRGYFDKYQSSQAHIDAIVESLMSGQTELQKDNAAIEQEKVNLWATLGRLRQYIYLGERLDVALAAKVAELERTDPERAKVLREDMLFYVRQKVQDLYTQLAVAIQGYLALDIIRKNNIELIKGCDRACTTTVSALRTAVIVAQALTSQRLVLDQISALNTTTGSLIESTSAMLRQQSGEINAQASSATVGLEHLQAAFANIYATMDEIDSFKLKALDSMAQTVTTLRTEVDKSQAYLDRTRAEQAHRALG